MATIFNKGVFMGEQTLRGVGLVEGIATLLFGIAAVFWPSLTAQTLLYIFAIFVVISGVANVIGSIMAIGDKGSSWLLRLVLGVLQLGVGVYLFRHPKVTFATLILLIGFTFIIRGIIEIVVAFERGLLATERTLLVLAGALGLIVGIVVLAQPVAGGIAFVWILGLYALIAGPIMIATALDNRRLKKA